jgi:hypothetical protein
MRASLVILPGHTEIESTVRCFGVDVEDALSPAERTEVQRLPGFPTYRAGSRLNQQAPMSGSQPKLVRSRKRTIRSAEGFSTIMGAS